MSTALSCAFKAFKTDAIPVKTETNTVKTDSIHILSTRRPPALVSALSVSLSPPPPHTLRPTRARAMSFAASARAFWNHPAGPKTIFFWAPTMKWGITAANVKDFSRPPELLSVPQQSAVTITGMIWTKYALDITPVNYNLMAVNMVMAATGLYQLSRRLAWDREHGAKASAT